MNEIMKNIRGAGPDLAVSGQNTPRPELRRRDVSRAVKQALRCAVLALATIPPR